ncbi:ustYa family protein [Pleurotus pulmonarius]
MDDTWTGLYDVYTYAISTLTEEENKRLPEPTVPSFGNMSRLYGGLDDYVRKAIEPERYGNSHNGHSSLARRRASKDLPHVSDTEHISHCIDMIRQSLMCSADISVISWYMPEASSPEHTPNPLPRFDQTRMCRDFDDLRDWARSRTPDAEGLEGVMPHGHGHGDGHGKF